MSAQLTREGLRRACQTDLFFLGKLLGYDLEEKVHGPICRFFVQKDPYRDIGKQDEIKQRLLLYPRGHFKTTIDIIDCIQWLLVNPDVRILLMSGTRELVTRMVMEMKAHFMTNKTLRNLFPECCPALGSEFGTTENFTIPSRIKKHLREPSVSISTAESVKAGSHYDVIKCDDLVNETNSATREQIEKVIQAFHYTTPLLDPGGYRDVIGTRYDYSDLYGSIIESDTKAWRIMQRGCWTIDDTGKKELLFPERFSLELLESYQRENPYLFNCQYLNNPIPTDTQHFPETLMRSHIIPPQQIPGNLRNFMTWDLGFTATDTSDYSVGAVGGWDGNGRLFVIDLFRGRFAPSTLVDMIIHGYQKWHTIRVGIEKAAGSRLLEAGIVSKANDLRLYMPVDWIPISNVKDAKVQRVGALESLMRENKLYINANIPFLDELLLEFTRFPKYKHNDIPDAIAHLVHYRTNVDRDMNEKDIEFVASRQYGYQDDDPVLGAHLVG